MSGPIVLSQSRAALVDACARRYAFEEVAYRRPLPKTGPLDARQFGSAWHRLLWRFYEAMKAGALVADCTVAGLAEVDASGVDHYGDAYQPPPEPDRSILRALLRAYAEVWGWHDRETYDVLEVERSFSLPALRPHDVKKPGKRPWYLDGLIVEGQLDLVVRHRKTGAAWVMDHKTTKSDFAQEPYWIGVELDLQVGLYLDAAARLGFEPAGFLYNCIRRPGAARAEKREDGESPVDYEERLYQQIIATDKSRALYFGRRHVTVQPWQIEEARADLIAAGEIVRTGLRTGLWKRNRKECRAYQEVCPWIMVCRRQQPVTDELFPLRVRRPTTNNEGAIDQ